MDLATPECLRLITEAMVPGMASAIIREGRLDRYVCCWARMRRQQRKSMIQVSHEP
jgi:hypothetical protein